MTPDEIGNAYNQITHLWESESFDRNNGIEQHQRALRWVKNRGKALDVGCGCTGRFIELLLDAGMQPTGLDVASKMVELAAKRHPNIAFYQADIRDYERVETYDFITAWDSIWHLPLQRQRPVISKIVHSLNPGGIFIFSFGGSAEAEQHSDNLMGPTVAYSTLGLNGFLSLFIELGCLIRHLEFDQAPALHAYLIVEKPQQGAYKPSAAQGVCR